MLNLKSRKPEAPEELNPNNNNVNPADLSFSSRGSNLRNIRLIIGREYNTRVRRRIFVISTIVLMLLVIVGAFIPTIIQLISSNSQTKIAVIDNTAGPVAGQNVVNYLDSTLNTSFSNTGSTSSPTQTDTNQKAEYKISPAATGETADILRKQVQDGKLDASLTVGRNPQGDLSFDYYSKNGNDSVSGARVRQALTVLAINDRLARSGLPQNQVSQLFSPPEIKVGSASQEKASNQGKSSEEQAASYLLAFVLVIILFTVLNIYGTAVAQGAAEEKSNRVMEIMVSAATPFQLMMGKIIGIGLAGFTQVGLVAVIGIIGFLVQGPVKQALLGNKTGGIQLDITALSISTLLFFLIFFVLGFFLWASLYAAVGSLVSRQEDVQGAIAPLSFLNIAAYLVVIFGLQSIDSTWVTAASYFPFFTPMVMFGRLALGAASWQEGLLGIGLLLVFIVLFTWLSARVYRAGVLMYGRKPSTAQIFKLMWSKGR